VAAALKPAPRAQARMEGVKLVADGRYEIDRGLIDKVLADPTSVSGSARVFPALENGKAVGFKLSQVRANSLVAQLGLQSGDQIRAINGKPLTSPDRAVEAYTKLQSASQLKLAVWRGGAPMDLEYQIR
jgi:general secretion pathway protein C